MTYPLLLLLTIYIYFKNIYLAALGLTCSLQDLLLPCKDSLVVVHGLSHCGVPAPEHVGLVVTWTHRLSCFAVRGVLAPQPGLKPMSPALQGRFLTTGPMGNSLGSIF